MYNKSKFDGRDISGITKLPFSPMMQDLVSKTPAITKASHEDLAFYFKDDPFYPKIDLPFLINYKFKQKSLTYNVGSLLEFANYIHTHFNLAVPLVGENIFIEGDISENELIKLDRLLLYGNLISPSGKKNYFVMGSMEESPFIPREESLVLTKNYRNPLTKAFVKNLKNLGFRFNSSLGTLIGLEEFRQVCGEDLYMEFKEDTLNSRVLQLTYGFELSNNFN